jgi:chromosomal replication initiator protein
VWDTSLGQLELQVTRPNFETWLRNTTGLRLDSGELIVGVPTDFAVEWLRSRLSSVVDRTVSQLLGEAIIVRFQVLGAPSRPAVSTTPSAPAAAASRPDLDARLTFDTFTVVKSNRLAYRAARRLAGGDLASSPLFIFGPTGLGKTHLLHAVGHALAASGRSVTLLTGEAFVTRYGDAVRAGQPHSFREAFHQTGCLLLDDVGFLSTRAASQEQFFHIFDALHAGGCPVAVTADVAPEALTGLSPRLRSRLQAGLAVAIQALAVDERLPLLTAKASHLTPPLPEPVLTAIAREPLDSARDLDGALNRLAAYADLSGKPLTPEDVQQALRPFAASQAAAPADAILAAVCHHFGLSDDQLSGNSRARDIAYARHVAMYLLRHHSSQSLADIGARLGGRDHTTVLSACRKIQKELASSLPSDTHHHIEQIESSLQNESVA